MITFHLSVQKMLGNFRSGYIDVHNDALAFIIDCNKCLDVLFPLFLFYQLAKSRSLLYHKKKPLLLNRNHHEVKSRNDLLVLDAENWDKFAISITFTHKVLNLIRHLVKIH